MSPSFCSFLHLISEVSLLSMFYNLIKLHCITSTDEIKNPPSFPKQKEFEEESQTSLEETPIPEKED